MCIFTQLLYTETPSDWETTRLCCAKHQNITRNPRKPITGIIQFIFSFPCKYWLSQAVMQHSDGKEWRSEALVQYYTRVHPPRHGQSSLWVAKERVPWTPGSLLLWCRSWQGVWERGGGGPLQSLSLCRGQLVRKQCTGEMKKMHMTGLEPATPRFEIWCPVH